MKIVGSMKKITYTFKIVRTGKDGGQKSCLVDMPESPFADMRESVEIQREALARLSSDFLGPLPETPQPDAPPVQKRASTIHFSDRRAQQFFVDGTKIPDVNFDAGPSWSGLMPISNHP